MSILLETPVAKTRMRLPFIKLSPHSFKKLVPEINTTTLSVLAVGVLALVYVLYFTKLTWAQQDAFLTHAEDLGIMDQAIWNTLHGSILHQTICNSLTDINCLGNVSRFSIHFEPILIPISFLYFIASTPKTLQLLQVITVGLGALPAFLLASKILKNHAAGICFALAFLLHPALQAAVTFDFHPETLSATFLMFALYFLVTRNNIGLFVSGILAMSTKEQIPVDVIMIGVYATFFQRRWRAGGSLIALSLLWLGTALFIIHAYSPLGFSPTAERYSQLGNTPVEAALFILKNPLYILQNWIFNHEGLLYLDKLFSPLAYLPLLGPQGLIIGIPAIAINLLSNSDSMKSGMFQYNADIVPVLIFSSMQAISLLTTASKLIVEKMKAVKWAQVRQRATNITVFGSKVKLQGLIMGSSLVSMVFLLGCSQSVDGSLPFHSGFSWPQTSSTHVQIGEDIIKLIPASSSVSAQANLVPHLSHRKYIYQYPYKADEAEYIVLDVTSSFYPYQTEDDYDENILDLLNNPSMSVIVNQDGYLLIHNTSAGSMGSP